MVVRKVRVYVERLVFGGVVLELGEDDGKERGCVARGCGCVFGEDLGVVCYAGAGVLLAACGGAGNAGHTRAVGLSWRRRP